VQIKRCLNCVLPTSLPSVKLDKNGICNHCRAYEEKKDRYNTEDRKEEFVKIVQQAKASSIGYDCLITLSGGKDSTYALYLCDKVYNLKCLCVTFDNGFMSDRARENIKNAIQFTNADHIFYTINKGFMLELYRLFLKKCGNFCSVCMYGIGLCKKISSKEFKIPLLVSGDGVLRSYLGSFPEVFQGGDSDFFKNIVKGSPIEKSAKQMFMPSSLYRNLGRILRIGLKLLRIRLKEREFLYIPIYDYFSPSREKVYETIKREMGWNDSGGEAEHMDCLLHEIPFYIHTLLFEPCYNGTALNGNNML
jgi:hypothetical protein